MAMRSTGRNAKKAKLSSAAPTVLSRNIMKPAEDSKLYRLIRLPNEMRCLLISDPTLAEVSKAHEDEDEELEGEEEEGEEEEGEEEEEGTKKAACALCVGVGSFSDPMGLDGLAHFTEHMVFMGTEKFPTENEWSSWLAEKGGEDNGETHLETTTCYFDVQPEHLRPCLERFASFYACPLFNFDSADREVKAIESEFQQAKTEDENRLYQLLCHLIGTGDPSHPYGRFSWGNARSLQQLPAERGVDMRAALRSFHEAHYSSAHMTLAVVGQEDLDTLEQWVSTAFGEMPNRHCPRPAFGDLPLPFDGDDATAVTAASVAKEKKKAKAKAKAAAPPAKEPPQWRPPLWIRMEPLKEKRTLDVCWFVQSLLPFHKSKPELYVTHILGHEGVGSVLAALKAEGLAADLCAGVDEDSCTSLASTFSVQIELTPAGLVAPDRVLELLFGGLGLLARTPPEERIFEEVRDTAAMRFRYQESEAEIDYVRRLAISLQRGFAPDETLSAEVLLSEFEPAVISNLLAQLTPSRAIVALSAPIDSGETGEAGEAFKAGNAGNGAAGTGNGAAGQWQTEPWFGARFHAEGVGGSRLGAWERAYEGKAKAPAGGPLALPPRNDYIPTDFTLRQTQLPAGSASAAAEARSPPSMVLSSAQGELFVKPDASFATPKVAVSLLLEISRPAAEAGVDRAAMARERLLNDVAGKMVVELIASELYAATLVGFSYEVTTGDRGWSIELHGFSHKLDRLLEAVCGAFRRLGEEACDPLALRRVLTQVELKLRNAGFAPADLAITERLRCLETAWLSAAELLDQLPAVTAEGPEGLMAHVARVLGGGVRLIAYVGGNVAADEAKGLFEAAAGALGNPSPLPSPPPLGRCVALPKGSRAVRTVPGRNPADENCAIDLYWQLGAETAAASARASLLEHLMYEPLFNELRTKQQLGYTVGCSARNTQGALGYLVSVVSATHGPQDIEARALAFVRSFVEGLATMPAKEYESNVRACVSNRLLSDKTIEDVCNRFWFEIEQRQYAFDRAEVEAAAMRSVTQADLASWAKAHLLATDARRLSVVIEARTGPAAEPAGSAGAASKASAVIDDPTAFTASLKQVQRTQRALPAVAAATNGKGKGKGKAERAPPAARKRR